MAEILVLNDKEVEQLVSFDENMRMVEQAFADYDAGKSHVFPVIREEIKKHQGLFGIKSGYLETQDVLGFKAGGFWINNKDRGLTTNQSAMLLFNPSTGQPCALVAANFVTKIRTAALGAIACKYLARRDSTVLGLIGAGAQGRNQLEATLKILPDIRRVFVYDQFSAAAEALAKSELNGGIEFIVAKSAEEAVRSADTVITATPSYNAIVKAEWIKPGTHINAVGTDTRGKQELYPDVFVRADKIVVDNTEQCIYLGECQHAYDAGLITKDSIYAEIGQIIRGIKKGRETVAEITVFDTTGVAIQDLATAGYAYQEAVSRGVGVKVTL